MSVLILINKWKQECIILEHQHARAMSYYQKLNYIIMISSILLSGLASASSLTIVSNTNENCSNNQSTLLIILNSIGILSSILISVHRFIGLSELQQQHDTYSDMYASLSNDISMNIALENGECTVFRTLDEFSKHVKSRLDVLIDKAPPIPKYIEKDVHVT